MAKQTATNRTSTRRPTARQTAAVVPVVGAPDGGPLFLNRELSWLAFNWRVIRESQNPENPLLERLKFIAISSANLDEFFMKRIGGLQRQVAAGVVASSLDGKSPAVQLDEVIAEVTEMIRQQREELHVRLIPALAECGIRIAEYRELSGDEQAEADRYFERSLFPLLTPLGVGPGHPFPFLSNQSLSVAVRLTMPGDEEHHFARIKVPSNISRFLKVGGGHTYVSVESVIIGNVQTLFPGAVIVEAAAFTVNRNADVRQNEEEADDLIESIREELRTRKFAKIVRLMINETVSSDLRDYLMRELELNQRDVYTVPGLLNLFDLFRICRIDVADQKLPEWNAVPHPRLRVLEDVSQNRDIFSILREGPLLVHHPYQSFNLSVLRFLEEAAVDPKVLAIKQTLYRTADNSPIVAALIRAQENGKQVAVLVEIKARFDEANNLRWVRELDAAGCHVAYGLVGLKTHAKLSMVVRDEEDGVRLYCHFGTGNYHTGTAKLYTDLGYFVSDNRFARDVTQVFNMLTGYSATPEFQHMLVAPVNMRERFLELIQQEAACGAEGRIIAKMNQLEDEEMIRALYRASQAGVKIDLLVRGLCCLRPGVAGMSENIRVRSIVGRFLEHSRIYHFAHGGECEYLIGSADWMRRNLDFRVETMVPVGDDGAREQIRTIFDSALSDTTNAWELQPDGKYNRVAAGKNEQRSHQTEMMEQAVSQVRQLALPEDSPAHRLRLAVRQSIRLNPARPAKPSGGGGRKK